MAGFMGLWIGWRKAHNSAHARRHNVATESGNRPRSAQNPAEAERGWSELSPFQSYDGIHGRTSSGLILDARVAHQQALQMDNDARSIIDGTPMRVPGEEGLRDMRVVDAIFRSVAEEGRVKIG